VAVTVQPANEGDTTTSKETVTKAAENVEPAVPEGDGIQELVADRGITAMRYAKPWQKRESAHISPNPLVEELDWETSVCSCENSGCSPSAFAWGCRRAGPEVTEDGDRAGQDAHELRFAAGIIEDGLEARTHQPPVGFLQEDAEPVRVVVQNAVQPEHLRFRHGFAHNRPLLFQWRDSLRVGSFPGLKISRCAADRERNPQSLDTAGIPLTLPCSGRRWRPAKIRLLDGLLCHRN
jgi:hypothetical protein